MEAEGSFVGLDVGFDRLTVSTPERTLVGRGRVDLDGEVELSLEELAIDGGGGRLELAEPARIVFAEGGVRVPGAVVTSEGESGRGSLRGAYADGAVDLTFTGFDPMLVASPYLPAEWSVGPLDGSVRGTVDPVRPDLAVDLTAREVVPGGGTPLEDVRLDGRLDPGRLSVVLEGRPADLGVLRVDLSAPVDPAAPRELFQPGDIRLILEAPRLRLDALDGLTERPTGLRGVARVEARLTGEWTALRGTVRVEARDVSTPEIVEAMGAPIEVDFEAELGERLRLVDAEVRSGDGELASFSGVLEIACDLPRWLESPGELLEVPVALDADLDLPLAGWTRRTRALRRLEGDLTGHGRVHGTLADPLLTGDLSLRDGELRLATTFPSVRAMNADLGFAGRSVTIRSLTGEIGAAPVEIEGSVELADGGPVLDLRLRGTNLLLARTETVKVRADAGLELRGPLAAMRVEGDLVVTEGRYARDVDVLGRLTSGGSGPAPPTRGFQPSFWTEAPLADMELDVRVRTERHFDLRSNVFDATVRPDLRIRGTGRVPMFEGNVYVDPSTVSLPSGKLQVRSGLLRFPREDPFSPRLSLSAGMRLRGYDIEAQVSGGLDEPSIVLSSNPSLPNDELLVLFLTGQLPQGSLEGQLGAAQSVGVYLAQDALTRWLSSSSADSGDSLLDSLVFELGAEVSRSGSPTAKALYYLGQRRSRTGRIPYLLAEQDKYDRTNFAYGIRFRFE